MNNSQPLKDFEPSPPQCSTIDWGEIQQPSHDIQRYAGADSNTTTPLTLETPAQPALLSIFPHTGPVLNSHTSYPSDGGQYFPPHPPTSQDYPLRLNQNIPTTGMAHHRSTALPTPQLTRDIYAQTPPGYRRPDHHTPRSPSFPLRRAQLSPPSSISFAPGGPIRMDNNQYGGAAKSQQNIPPLESMTSFGTLQYSDGHNTTITPEIIGTIDKGFFLSENEWTCYRRNYFSCVCSFNLAPYYSSVPMTFQATSAQTIYPVTNFAMSISAMVSESDGHKIDLVQHTPKRDKGPITTPEKMRMAPKVSQPAGHHGGLSMFGAHADPTGAGMTGRNIYEGGYGQPQQSAGPTTEYSFERIQFKQATANNGKRRAAQQYYHLLVELWVEVGSPDHPQYLKVAQRKSAKMIVRGRSPGHYQSERRSSTSSGPGGSGGTLGGYGSGVMGSEFGSGPGPMLGPGPYSGPYDPRSGPGGYGVGTRHHSHQVQVPAEADVPPEEAKNMESRKGLQIYSAGAYEGADSSGRVEQYPPLPRLGRELATTTMGPTSTVVLPQMATGFDPTGSKVKNEYDTSIPSLCYPGPSYPAARCGPYESKTTSAGYYPTMLPAPGLNMT